MNEYMIALKGGFDNWSKKPELERKEVMSQFELWAKLLMDKRHYQNCVRPKPTAEHRRITIQNGKMLVEFLRFLMTEIHKRSRQ